VINVDGAGNHAPKTWSKHMHRVSTNMARFMDPTPEEEAKWAEGLVEFPDHIRQLADPWSLYRIKSTGELVIFDGIVEHPDGELTISVIYVDMDNNRTLWGRDVPVDDLEPCEPSGTDEEIDGIATARDRGQRLISGID
jgi:hypothetical protein